VVVLTRWHQDDLIGWLLEQESGEAPQRWQVLNLPAIAELPQQQIKFPATCTIEPDWRQPGEPLCPERFPLVELEQIRIRAGSYWWNALYQQRPSPAEGLLFQRAWIRTTAGTPAPDGRATQRPFAAVVLSCDLSFKGGAENDCSACCRIQRPATQRPWPRQGVNSSTPVPPGCAHQPNRSRKVSTGSR
jgi:hypothetical protein